MDSIEKALYIAGKTDHQDSQGAAHSANLTYITGTARGDSSDGSVSVDVHGHTISDTDEQAVDIPTTAAVSEGDTVQIAVIGADGSAKSMMVIGVIAGGDRTKTEIEGASTAAESAKSTADSAKSTADTAKSTADSAKSAAETAQTTADSAKTTAETASSAASAAQTTANGAIGTAQTLYRASGSTSVPSKPTSAVTASGTTTYDTWETVLPTYSEQYPYLYTCSQTKTQAGTYAWTNVVTGSYADYITVPASNVQTAASADLEEAVQTLRGETDTKLSSQKEQTDSDIKEAVDKSASSLTSSMSDMKSQLEQAIKGNSDAVSQLKQWLTFDEDNGLRVGETGTGYYIRIKGERISFMYGDAEMYYLSNSKLYIKDAQITSTLSFGQDTAQWAYVPRSNGNLSFRWIGG